MPGITDIGNLWDVLKEIDTRPLVQQAEREIFIGFVGAEQVGKRALIHALDHNARANEQIVIPALAARLASAAPVESANLIVLVLDAGRADFSAEAKLYGAWISARKRVLVFYNKMDTLRDTRGVGASLTQFPGARFAFGCALDPRLLEKDFVPRVLNLLPEEHLALARRFPLFRDAVAQDLVNETARANALYSVGTGLAEAVPGLNIPFNLADLVILTKNQALMVYKLGLALGLATRWQDHVAELGGVVGAGFVWRQIARQLVGLIPVWGIIPKVAVAYAGTYALGEAILYWYKTGRKLPGRELRELYSNALTRGNAIARELTQRTQN